MTGQQTAEPSCLPSVSRPLSDEGLFRIIRQPVSYTDAWTFQSRLHRERVDNIGRDTVLILEHRPVYTLGRSTLLPHWGGDEAVLRSSGTDLCRVNRGGSVTYHGPGQIVMYPILRLAGHAAGPKRFVWLLEEVIIRVLHRWGVEGRRMDKNPGVWTGDAEPAKLASIGIRVERGVTLHGCALNVEMDLAPFALIQPCGMADIHVTSMAALLQRPLPLQDIKQHVAAVFREVFSIAWPIALADRLDSSTFLASRPHA